MPNDNPAPITDRAPWSDHVGPRGITALMLYLIAMAVVLLWAIHREWPTCDLSVSTSAQPAATVAPTTSPSPVTTVLPAVTTTVLPAATPTASATATPTASASPTATASPGSGVAGGADTTTNAALPPCPLPAAADLLLLVILAGALGSTVHAIRSLFWYIGNRELIRSWVPMYILLPLNGATIALAFHLIVIGGFVSNLQGSSTWLGLVGIAAMVGLFSQQASLKMRDIANAIFTKPTPGEDNKPQPTAANSEVAPGVPKLVDVKPAEGPLQGGQAVVIAGSGFAAGAKVSFGDQSATDVVVVNANEINAKTPPAQNQGAVAVRVTNLDNQSDQLAIGYTYREENAGNAAGAGNATGNNTNNS